MISYDNHGWRLLFQFRGSVLPRVAGRTLVAALIGGALVVLKRSFGMSFGIPSAAHGMVGVALGLLLVFRTNASYDRYWEGRKLLGGIVNRSRNLMRQAAQYIEGEDALSADLREDVRRLSTSLYVAIRQYLRGERKMEEHEPTLRLDEIAALDAVAVPQQAINGWLSSVLARAVREKRLSEERLRMLDENLTAICELWGGAERIIRTPVPFAYAHHIKGFLVIFCFSVPFALLDSMGIGTPLAAAVVAYGLFGIEEIGVEIEDPFGYDPNDLPLDAIGTTIARDAVQTLASRTVPSERGAAA